MSRGKTAKNENFGFVERLVEVCGSAQAADVARALGISYQAAKNYLQGRVPDSKVLQQIAERTPYSLHWLLTGVGSKYVTISEIEKKDTIIPTDALRALIRELCLEVVGEVLKSQPQIAGQSSGEKIVVLSSHRIKEEKIFERTENLSSK